MYGVYKPLVKESILDHVSPWDIFRHYIPQLIEEDRSFVSDLRDETNASCRVTNLNGSLRYKDFGSSDRALDCFAYVQKKFGLNYNEVLKKIVFDLNLSDFIDMSGVAYNEARPVSYQGSFERKIVRKPAVITVERRPWQILDKMFWYDKYGITQKYLELAKIYPIKGFHMVSNNFPQGRNMQASVHSYVFDYYMNIVYRRKIYQPYNEYLKWISNVDNTIVQGIDLLPKEGGEVLFITSSFKDAAAITCNTGIYAIAPNAENSFIPEKVFHKLKAKWKHIILWFDNDYHKPDNPGLKFSQETGERYNLPFVLTPDGYEKDPSDFINKFARGNFVDLTKHLLRRNGIRYEIFNHNRFR